MEEKQVVLIRKQSTPFTINFPMNDRIKKFIWNGTKGKLISKKSVPFEVYDWLAQYTSTLSEGCLIVENTDDEEVIEIKNTVDNIEKIEKAILTKSEIEEILTTGNHLVLKKALNELVEGLSEDLAKNQKRYFISVAGEIGVDSSAKRKVLADWAEINFETSDLVLDKELKKMYDESEE